jgi:hypothetical protein
MSPFKATLGFEPTSPTTSTFEDNEHDHTLPEQVKILVELHRYPHGRVKAAHAHMQESANRHRLRVPLTFGDKVKLEAANLRFKQQAFSKLRDRYGGQIFIMENVSPVSFQHHLPLGVRIHDDVHASPLEKWNSNIEQADSAQRIPIVHDATRFKVDRLLAVAFNSNGTGLLLKVR